MILTDKAKQEFILWYLKSEYNFAFDGLSNNFQNALIIEWFDSVGIYIFTDIDWQYKYFNYKLEYKYKEVDYDYVFNTRQEATTKAIDKANEIFNNI